MATNKINEYQLRQQGQIAIIWSIEDVLEVRPELTESQAFDVLKLCKRRHDATVGINWDTLAYAADVLYPEPDLAV